MDRDPFVPADGQRSRKTHCVELVRTLKPFDQVPISEVMELLDCTRQAAWAAMGAAAEYLEGNGEQSVQTQGSFGWVVIDRDEAMLKKAKRRLDKTAKAASRAARTTMNVDRDRLSRFDQQDHDQLVRNMAKVAEIRQRKTRPLAEIAREAEALRREVPDQRVRQLPTARRREGA